mmetsp:Transcript_25303/g.57517  ORF Transcript_25303/g.57517 Transcript_25303/m.57517 type:complete len:671 (+) Transcript_25303:38-2050(+)
MRRSGFGRPPPVWWPGKAQSKDSTQLVLDPRYSGEDQQDTAIFEDERPEHEIFFGKEVVRVEVDEITGPQVRQLDGSTRYCESLPVIGDKGSNAYYLPLKRWPDMTITEREVHVHMAAKRSLRPCRHLGISLPKDETEQDAEDEDSQFSPQALEMAARYKADMRCKAEQVKQQPMWWPVSQEQLMNNHDRVAPGMIYGLEFPWNQDMLAEFGPQWLTRAFHTAGTLDYHNAVTSVRVEKKIKVTGGNNAGKFLFDVTYRERAPGLHTKLFAKVPFLFSGPTKGDRISSSVYKQLMDLVEINTYRLLESALPTKTPKFYFGDISNETTNYILITERVPFAEMGGKWRKGPLKPLEIEGPYDKCKDFQIRGSPKEYYGLLMQTIARIAGLHKSGRMGDPEMIKACFMNPRAAADDPEAWGLNPDASTGEAPVAVRRKLDSAYNFVSQTAKVVFPPYVGNSAFKKKFIKTLMTASAYTTEVMYFKHSHADYVALGHQNLNADNAYFWRDEQGALQCGVFDWGGFGTFSLGHKIWWTINCADFDHVSVNLSTYVDMFVAEYHASGGPRIDPERLMHAIFLTSFENALFMVAAVPNCHKMCQLKEWETIRNRSDPRISENIDGKSTLRTTLHVLDHCIRIIEELEGDKRLEQWIERVWEDSFMMTAKTDNVINGK